MIVTLLITEDECNALAKMIDTAVRVDGIVAAQVALPIFQKLQAAVKTTKEKGPRVPTE